MRLTHSSPGDPCMDGCAGHPAGGNDCANVWKKEVRPQKGVYMAEMILKVVNSEGQAVAVSHGQDETYLVCDREYQEGDRLVFIPGDEACHVWLQLMMCWGSPWCTSPARYPMRFLLGKSG